MHITKMLLKFGILSMVLYLANSQECGNNAVIEVCLGNKNLEVQVSAKDLTSHVTEISGQKVRADYTHVPGVGYYKFHAEGKKWNDARKVCKEEDGHLAIINSSAEEKAIIDLFNNAKQSISKSVRIDAWLGAHNLFANNSWVTILGDELASSGYVNWSKGCDGYPPEPNNNGGIEHCLAIYGDHCQGWNDYNCEAPLPYVCEISDACA